VTEATEDSVRELLASFLAVPASRLLPDAELQDLGVDSLAAVELIFEIETRFGVSVPNDRAAEFRSVRAITAGVRELQKASA
jgi:acyl carrier protein